MCFAYMAKCYYWWLSFSFLCLQPDSQIHIHWKGAAEIVLASCTQYIDAAGQIVAMDEDKVGCIITFQDLQFVS